MRRLVLAPCVLALASCATAQPQTAATPAPPAPAERFSFALSGDSRDCGDLIVPKIAAAVESDPAPVDFYWHLGDFRRIYDVDCDMAKRWDAQFDCKERKRPLPDDAMSRYLETAWDDFAERQLGAFKKTRVYVGIGNHELYYATRDDYKKRFVKWLAQAPIHAQRRADYPRRVPSNTGDTFFHVIHKGVDFVSLDNADEGSFSAAQLVWLQRLVNAALADSTVKAIVVGMHAALPYSKERGHAMDSSCQGLCSGQQAYDILARAQLQKKVYVFASHSHFFRENVYDTPEHRGQVLPGWIVGTAGAVQYQPEIRYGWVKVTVDADGTLTPEFREVTRTSPPLATGPGAEELTEFCFRENSQKPGQDAFKGDCACGAAKRE